MRFLSLILCATLLVSPTMTPAEDTPREIVVTGEGRVSAEPDMAVLSLGVTRDASTAKDAMDQTSAAVSEVLETLSDAGIEARDMQTSALSLSPRWDHSDRNGPPKVVGYVASNTLSIRVRDLDGLGETLDRVIGSGANQMNGLSFTLSNPRPIEDSARINAVQDAKAKATLLAEAAGVTLGAVQTISEGFTGGPAPTLVRREAMMASDVPIAAGEVDVRINVAVVFAIKD
jgi:uncharacterized protein YggE